MWSDDLLFSVCLTFDCLMQQSTMGETVPEALASIWL